MLDGLVDSVLLLRCPGCYVELRRLCVDGRGAPLIKITSSDFGASFLLKV